MSQADKEGRHSREGNLHAPKLDLRRTVRKLECSKEEDRERELVTYAEGGWRRT
jgi:hypothetical protein